MPRKTIKSLEAQIATLRKLRSGDARLYKDLQAEHERLKTHFDYAVARADYAKRNLDRLLFIMENASKEGNFPRKGNY